MEFEAFQKLFVANSKKLLEYGNLFLVDMDRETLWNTYLESYPAHLNEIFRERREMDCSCCRHFVKDYGNLVAITPEFDIVTLWSFDSNDDKFQPMLLAMRNLVQTEISHAFFSKSGRLGTKVNYEDVTGGMNTWNHLYLEVPQTYVCQNPAESQEVKRAVAQVFRRSLEEISSESIETVLDLIAENTLYRGEEWKSALITFKQIHHTFHSTPDRNKNRFVWKVSGEIGMSVAKIKNHSIGTLLMDLTTGLDVDQAVRKWEGIMAPSNYKRPKTIFTAKMVEDAKKKTEELGLSESLGRRFAVLSDITINNVIWANRAAKTNSGSLSPFDTLKDVVSVNPSNLKNIRTVGVQDFMNEIGNAKTLEVLFENRHSSNMMSLIAPENKESPSLFKWNNGFSWAYANNLADSMKEQVRSAGGKVDGILRFSIRWNENNDNKNDYDAHAKTPTEHIYFSAKHGHPSNGELDVDIVHPTSEVAVENITWGNTNRMKSGDYLFSVHCYNHNGGTSGFDAEVEMDGEIYSFSYPNNVKQGEMVNVATVNWNGSQFSIKNHLNGSGRQTSKTIWNIETNQFHPVSTVMFSPNYWDDQIGIGNKHFFFMLQDCLNDSQPNGFYNEFLREDFTPYRKVFEALGSKMKVPSSQNQLSGLGFSTTKQDYLIVRMNGQLTKIVF